MSETPNILKGLIRPHELVAELMNDVNHSFELLNQSRDSQFYRRTTLRNIFSFIEASINIIKYELKREIRLGHIENILTTKENENLYEEKITIKNNASTVHNIIIPLDKNLKVTFRIAKKLWKLKQFILDINSDGYDCFKHAKLSRNKLTHPKDFYDIQITTKDIKDSYLTHIWVKNNFIKLFREKINIGLEEFPEDVKKRFWEET
jgi:hypothetical protein